MGKLRALTWPEGDDAHMTLVTARPSRFLISAFVAVVAVSGVATNALAAPPFATHTTMAVSIPAPVTGQGDRLKATVT